MSPVDSPYALPGQWHAMVNVETGDLFYPDNADDAYWFAAQHHAEPVFHGKVRALVGQHVLCRRFPCGDCQSRPAGE